MKGINVCNSSVSAIGQCAESEPSPVQLHPVLIPAISSCYFCSSDHLNLALHEGSKEATDPESIQAAAKKAEAHLGGSGLNLLINNAGVMPESTLELATAADMLAVYKINVVGPMLVTQKGNYWPPSNSLDLLAVIPEGSSEHRKVWASCHQGQKPTSLGRALRTRVKFHSPPFMCMLQAELTVEDSVQGLLKVISTLSEKHHGIVVDWTGRNVPW
ncbi:cytochrome P450 2A13-like [Platysternon megacephalum]|uniref:Cytochrome P450 2A13-like n=1 Tax=Platysternon megacephalum TaxID=55544 RepID=A0A4D9DRN3_9SAUR|nr:cytochrome P450 2A13-like [Platysternon megacephalum]